MIPYPTLPYDFLPYDSIPYNTLPYDTLPHQTCGTTSQSFAPQKRATGAVMGLGGRAWHTKEKHITE